MSARLRAIVVNKGTMLEQVTEAERDATMAGDPGYWEQIRNSHKLHTEALGRVCETLQARGWDYRVVDREAFTGADDHALVISVGGDGTVLHASHNTLDVPLLGVNSDPERSVGYFCATNADGVDQALKAFEADRLERFILHRLRIEVDGKTVAPPALNDVLVANENPAATCRYVLIAGPREEPQKSSGVWISTPAGSTAGIRSAGGVVLPLEGAQLQYLVREPVHSRLTSYELLRGVRALEEGIVVVSQMASGYAYVDGPYVQVPLPLGARMRISAHKPLTLLGLEPERRER